MIGLGFTETRNHFRSAMSLAMSVDAGTLIDFETTGIPRRTAEHEVVTLGALQGSSITITQRRTADGAEFYHELRETLAAMPRPYFAYNASFEREVMECELGMSVTKAEFEDLMDPWKAMADDRNIKWPRLDDLISEPEEYFGEPQISGRDVPNIWKQYLKTGDERLARSIMEHCLSDILREAVLLIRYQH